MRVSRDMAELGLAIGLTVVALLALIEISTTPGPAEAGPGGLKFSSFPTFVSAGLLVLSLFYIATTLGRIRIKNRQSRPIPGDSIDSVTINLVRRAGVVVLLLAYAYLLPTVHFAILTGLFLFVLFLLFGRKNFPSAIVAAVGAAAMSFVFLGLLRMPL